MDKNIEPRDSEIFVDHKEYRAKKFGPLCRPTVKELIHAIHMLDHQNFSLMLECSTGEIINGVDAEGKTPLFHLLKELSEWEGYEIIQGMLEDMLRHPEINMEGVELNSPQDASYVIKALQKNLLLVPKSPVSFICNSGSMNEANVEGMLVTPNVFNQEGVERYNASASAAEPDSAGSECLGDVDHS